MRYPTELNSLSKVTAKPEVEAHSGRLQEELARLLDLLTPSSVLCVGGPAESLIASTMTTSSNVPVSTLSLDHIPSKLDELPTCGLAYVHGAVERLPRSVAGMLLARLRDVSARHLLVHVGMGSGWPEHTSDWENNDLLAFGLIKAGEYTNGGLREHIYQFNIFDYKLTPDWFNSQQWAHPHRWEA